MSRRFAEPALMGSISAARAEEGRFFIEPDLLKQVEVYRGANSALYGSGAIGGVITLSEHLYPAILKIQDTNLVCAPVLPACGRGRIGDRRGLRALADDGPGDSASGRGRGDSSGLEHGVDTRVSGPWADRQVGEGVASPSRAGGRAYEWRIAKKLS